MAIQKSKAELRSELDEANDYIDQLEGKLNDIVGIAADENDDSDEADDEEEDDEEENEEENDARD